MAGSDVPCVPGVRSAIDGSRVSLPFSRSRENRCEKTAWYPLFIFAICTLLAQVVLTLRFGAFPVVQRLSELALSVSTGYML